MTAFNPNPPHVSEALWPLVVSIDRLKPMKGNPRRGDIEAVKRSVLAFKMRKPVVAMSDGTITAGHHLYYACSELGYQELAVVFVDDDLATAKAYSLADNRSAELGSYDDDLLAAMIRDVHDDEALFLATSYTEEFYQKLLGEDEPIDFDDAPAPQPVVAYNIIFDNEDQQARFYGFIRWLKTEVDGDTVAERLDSYIRDRVDLE